LPLARPQFYKIFYSLSSHQTHRRAPH